jgi:hypothetical protein
MDSSSKYLEQFDRVKRWYQRFVTIDEGRQHNLPSDNYQDEAYAFFLNCYHLKDWIKNDESVGAAAYKVEDFIKNNKELNLCRDICNGIKHLKLTKPRSGQDPRFGQRKFHLQVGGTETTISVRYTIDASSGPVDAFELATKCLKAWENFILSNINEEASA